MKRFTIRYFSRNFFSCLGDLPIIVTRRGKPYLRVEEIKDVTTSKKEAFSKLKEEDSFRVFRPQPKSKKKK